MYFLSFVVVASHPFLQAFFSSDALGKAIFLALFALSVISWSLIAIKTLQMLSTQKNQKQTRPCLLDDNLLSWNPHQTKNGPYTKVYTTVRNITLDLLEKNSSTCSEGFSMLTTADIDLVMTQADIQRREEVEQIESFLFLLSLITTLAPFLGLLGTVWGILDTFSAMHSVASSNREVLSGLSLALATTVLGLLDAIPALIGYNILKNQITQLDQKLEHFSYQLITRIELLYRQVS